MNDDLKYLGNVHGETMKPFSVFRDVEGTPALGWFDTMDEARAYIGKQRLDWRFIIRERRRIIWPESRVRK